MKRSDRGTRIKDQKEKIDKGWPLCHVYQIIAGGLVFLVLILWTEGILPWDQTFLHYLEEWITETWEEWIRGSTNF